MKITITILILLLTITTLGQNDSTKRKTLTVRKEKEALFKGTYQNISHYGSKSGRIPEARNEHSFNFDSATSSIIHVIKHNKSHILSYKLINDTLIIITEEHPFKNIGIYNKQKDQFEFIINKWGKMIFKKKKTPFEYEKYRCHTFINGEKTKYRLAFNKSNRSIAITENFKSAK